MRTISRRRRRRRAQVAGVAALLAAASTGSPAASEATDLARGRAAYPQDPNNCNDPTIEWRFEAPFDSMWSAGGVDRLTATRDAINKILEATNYAEVPAVTLTEQGGNPSASLVQIKDKPLNEYGSAECEVGASFWVNANYSALRFYWHVAKHEMMHLLGAEHGANSDGSFGDAATMATCVDWTEFPSNNVLDRDAAAYLAWLHDPLADRQLNENVGLDVGAGINWGSGGPTTWSLETSGGHVGPSYMAWKSLDTDGHVFKEYITVHTGDDDESYQAVTSAKAMSSDYKTAVSPVLYRQTVEHSQPDNGCSYPDGIDNPNDWTTTGGWVKLAEEPWTEVGTSWSVVESGWVNPPTADGYRFNMRVYGIATHRDTGEFGSVLLDNIRGDGT